ncbi:MAG TPA: gamma-glutamyl-gamma-aminobutyrate hydrolase family protein [Actinomycetes bacterium]|jgi:putative glutamine amidotransferase|nr:gamma-glutamyl-gamma-aminobutyrate hydrolase family protein [Actinomycetes bacterium]
MQAVIGLSSRSVDLDGRFGTLPADTVSRSYTAALRAAHGIPLVLPTASADEVDAVLERIDGLILTGGGDVDPSTYGRESQPSISGLDIDRDRFEIQLVLAACERAVPVLAICRGLQIANVACGGDLIVDIPTEVPGDVGHRASESGDLVTHSVRLDRNSRLARLVGGDSAHVNSSHHQAALRLGAGMRAVAWAADGVVEAIETVDERRWLLGVQWHPEQSPREEPAGWRPFEALVDAAAERYARRFGRAS